MQTQTNPECVLMVKGSAKYTCLMYIHLHEYANILLPPFASVAVI